MEIQTIIHLQFTISWNNSIFALIQKNSKFQNVFVNSNRMEWIFIGWKTNISFDLLNKFNSVLWITDNLIPSENRCHHLRLALDGIVSYFNPDRNIQWQDIIYNTFNSIERDQHFSILSKSKWSDNGHFERNWKRKALNPISNRTCRFLPFRPKKTRTHTKLLAKLLRDQLLCSQ